MSVVDMEARETARPTVLDEAHTGHIHGAPGMECVLAHDVPGRVRFSIRSLKSDNSAARLVSARLEALERVVTARPNPLTGSFIVVFDGALGTRARIFAGLKQLSYPVQASPHPRNTSITGAVAKTLIHLLVDNVLSVAVAAVI